MAITINEVERGMALKVDNEIWTIVDFNHVKPCKGSAFVRIRMRSVKNGNTIERTYRSAETLDDVPLEERTLQYQYHADDMYYFMDQTTFEEHRVSRDELGENVVRFLLDNMELSGFVYQDKVLKVALPNFIITKIVETEPGVKGDSTKSNTKPAKIATGTTILVPLFVNVDEEVKIDTRSGEYVERVKR